MLRLFLRRMSTEAQSTRTPIPVFGVEGKYVSALYSAGNAMKQLEGIEKDLRGIQPSLTRPVLVDFIETSMMSGAEKGELLKQIGSSAGLQTATQNFLALVAENGRLKKLRRMINMFLAVMVAHRKEALCEVITAKPLNEKSRERLMDALKKFAKGKNVTLTEKVDPSIIGGMIVGIEDKHMDMSIARKIQMYTDIMKQSI